MPAATTPPGEGPLVLTNRSYDCRREYLSLEDPLYFAVSKDGRSCYYVYCGYVFCGTKGACTDRFMPEHAIAECQVYGTGFRCHPFAEGKDIVWQGEVSNATHGWSYTPPYCSADRIKRTRALGRSAGPWPATGR